MFGFVCHPLSVLTSKSVRMFAIPLLFPAVVKAEPEPKRTGADTMDEWIGSKEVVNTSA